MIDYVPYSYYTQFQGPQAADFICYVEHFARKNT